MKAGFRQDARFDAGRVRGHVGIPRQDGRVEDEGQAQPWTAADGATRVAVAKGGGAQESSSTERRDVSASVEQPQPPATANNMDGMSEFSCKFHLIEVSL